MDEPADPRAFKIFPRNLTARADRIVRGNPMSSRPESGMNNSYPGLEFDQRVLEQRFFPGLVFEFQRPDGAVVVDMPLTGLPSQCELRKTDSPLTRRLYLWYVYGRFVDLQPSLFACRGQLGMHVWRRIRDLLPGRVAIMIGVGPPTRPLVPLEELGDMTKPLRDAFESSDKSVVCTVKRGPDDQLESAVLAGERARYLDEDGVIDGDPGELTKTMCAPWMYDFRDCYCFYWAANKPDLVDTEDGTGHNLNFMRKDRTANDVAVWSWIGEDGTPKKRRDLELTYEDMVQGAWNDTLPVVLNDRETSAAVAKPARRTLPAANPLTRAQAIAELRYLATVEHALVLEYLYAFYSLKGGRTGFDQQPTGFAPRPDPFEVRTEVAQAAEQVFAIAVDEMRHMVWANQLLWALGERSPSTGRAEVIGASPTPRSGRKIYPPGEKQYANQPFNPQPLTLDTLDRFIRIEQQSRTASAGMYIEALASIAARPDWFPEAARLVPIVKLLIDEGDGHYRRFQTVHNSLQGLPPDYLNRFDRLPDPRDARYLRLCGMYYAEIIASLEISFRLDEGTGRRFVEAAVASMRSLNDVARWLADRGVAPVFWQKTPWLSRLAAWCGPANRLKWGESLIGHALHRIAARGGDADHEVVHHHRQRVGAHFDRMRRLVAESMPRTETRR